MTAVAIAVARPVLPRSLGAPASIEGPHPYTFQSTGYIYVPENGTRLALYAEGPARVASDNRFLVETTREGESVAAEAIAAGVHRIVLQYGASRRNQPPILKWQFGMDGGPMNVPTAALSPRPLGAWAWRARPWIEPLGLALGVAWLAVLAWPLVVLSRRAFLRHTPDDPIHRRAVAAVVSLSLLVYGYAIWWGLPVGWAQDEIGPTDVLTGLERRFSGGWSFLRYPPLHFFVLTAAYAPILLLAKAGLVDVYSDATVATLATIGRTLSVAMGMGTTALAYHAGRMAATPRAGVLAALVWTLVLPAAFYAKTVNLDVPSTFWLALSLIGYLRAIQTGTTAAHVLFGAAAAAAVCTKDQTYGFYAAPALHLAALAARRRAAGLRALAAGAAAGLVAFAIGQNVIFNPYGFIRHVESITGGSSEAYRFVDSTSASGQLWLLQRAGWQMVWSLSWPGALWVIAAVAAALADAPYRRFLLALTLCALSYYVTFIGVVGYHYDRFFIPVCLVLAVPAGRLLDRVLTPPAPRLRAAAIAAVLVYMAWRTASVSALMAADGRYDTESWLATHVRRGTTIATVEFPSSLPRLTRYAPVRIFHPLTDFGPRNAPVAIVTTEYRERFPEGAPERDWYDALVAGRLDYRVAHRHKASVPLAVITHEGPFRRRDASFTTLHKINPEVIVLVRDSQNFTSLSR